MLDNRSQLPQTDALEFGFGIVPKGRQVIAYGTGESLITRVSIKSRIPTVIFLDELYKLVIPCFQIIM